MQLQSILTLQRTYFYAPGSSKKRVLEHASQFICEDIRSMNPDEVFSTLLARERLGSTGLGKGIAIPHCRMKNCTSIIGTLVRLQESIDYDAIDDQPVDLLFVLLVPDEATDEHLQTLAMLAELFSQEEFCQQLRNARSAQELFNVAINYRKAA